MSSFWGKISGIEETNPLFFEDDLCDFLWYSPAKLTCPLTNDGWKTMFLLKWSLFQGTFVDFRGGVRFFCGKV